MGWGGVEDIITQFLTLGKIISVQICLRPQRQRTKLYLSSIPLFQSVVLDAKVIIMQGMRDPEIEEDKLP
jgi:hypothetical protein